MQGGSGARLEPPKYSVYETRVMAKGTLSLEESHFAKPEEDPELRAPTLRAVNKRAFERQPKSNRFRREDRKIRLEERAKRRNALERQPRSRGPNPKNNGETLREESMR